MDDSAGVLLIALLVRLMDAIVDRLADELESVARQMESVSAQIFARQSVQSGRARSTERRLQAILLQVGRVQGLMAEVIDKGYRHMEEADLKAIAAYLESLPPIENEVKKK